MKDIPMVKNYNDDEIANLKKIVIAIHGFSSSKESRNITTAMPALKQNGYGMIAFDLPGHGENKEKLGIKNCLNCIKRVEDDLRAKYSGPICIRGSSFGGYLTLLYLINNNRQYSDILLLAPAIDFYKTFSKRCENDKRESTIEFLKEVKNYNVFAGANKIKEKLNIIYATKDEIVDNSEIFELAKIVESKTYPIEGAKHHFTQDEREKAVEIILTILGK